MAVYEYACLNNHSVEANFPMGEAPPTVICFDHHCTARRVLGNFNFSQDNYRHFRNPQDGSKFSYALGMEHPDNRRDYNAVCAALGSEPVTKGTMPTKWKEDREYADHVRSGGERLKNDGHVPVKSDTTVLKQLQKSGITIP